ncbi:MAG: FHA domain-containing protein [Erythrobacter sp.]
MAFQECGGIVDDGGLCPICVQPHLQIVPGATMQAAVGGSVTVPFDLVNESQVDRPLFVKGLWSREGGDWREERLGWEKLAPGERAAASVTANEIDKPGLHQIEILWAISTQWKTREEHFAYSTSVLLAVPDSRSQAGTSVQVNAEHQKGSIIQVKVPDGSGTGIEREVTAIDMKVTRQDREERRLGLRSIDGALRFPRSARFDFRGFEKSQCPPSGQPVVTPDAMLVFGRAHSRNQGGDTDVRLLVIDQNGQVDESQSLAISRRHFEIFAENDRPILRVAGSNGVRVNGKAFGPDKKVVLQDGDEIGALVDNPAALTLKVSFRRELQRVTEVILQRTPSLPGTA